ncbi:nucleotidyltransferase family protein [Chitinophaga nivalis]|uniref:Nucleotidyltransferase family protein n=1 Tax=Chitinophaga nivalis TaxID=2991709 RepID=A0ABT3IR60_9BACT|nr:nucleotidyltransferase family protein [Chitinophaga nivalis]MCW3463838.1 nucleotidyltransferase family protein [Chitinophaga nivalis]MCW3486472.1 nucleotidyltransferase family protein [Chitinophaga nivalis]
MNHTHIKARLLKTAARLWGYPDTAIATSFDPIVQLLLEACATELEKITEAATVSQGRLLEQLAQLLLPAPVINSEPAAGILHAMPAATITDLPADHPFVYPAATEQLPDLFFAPLTAQRLFPAHIQYLVIGNQVFTTRDYCYKTPLLTGTSLPDIPSNDLWLGLSVTTPFSSLAGMSFFFDLRSVSQQTLFYHHLPLTRFFLDDQELPVTAEYAPAVTKTGELSDIITDTYTRYTQHIRQRFRHHFLTILDGALPATITTPPVLKKLFGTDISQLDADIQWIRVAFPAAIPVYQLESLYCSINCFPVINIKRNEQSHRLQPYLNILPLQTPDSFFAIKSIRDTNHTDYQLHTATTSGNPRAGTFIVRHGGVGRFDSRTAKVMLASLLEVIRDESALFEAVKNEVVSSRLQEIYQLLTSLETQVPPDILREEIPYVMLQPNHQAGYLFLEFYTTNGTAANHIRMGSQLKEYSHLLTIPHSITLLTTTQGGKNRMTGEEKINVFRAALLSRERIVTTADIKALCRVIFGDIMRIVTVEKGITIQPGIHAGYSRTIDIRITLQQPAAHYAATDIQYMKTTLLLQLAEKSVQTFPYRVFINDVCG